MPGTAASIPSGLRRPVVRVGVTVEIGLVAMLGELFPKKFTSSKRQLPELLL